MKVEAEDLWPLILDFVETHFGEDDLASFKKFFKLKIAHKKDPLVKAGGIQAMLGCFLKHNKDVFKTFKAHLSSKTNEESSSSESEDEKPKKLAGKKRKAKEESSSSSSSSSEDEKPAPKRKRSGSVSSRTRAQSDVQQMPPPPPKGGAPHFKFQRINEDKFRAVVEQSKTEGASFESKGNYGTEGDKFGEWSYERLRDKRGESFKKEKGKMKNRNFHSAGQRISGTVNSIKF